MSNGFSVHSPAFADGGAIPRRHTCDGEDLSPPLQWNGAPAGTAAFALIVDDRDARGFVHWVVEAIPASISELPEGLAGGFSPAQLVEGRTDFGRAGWGGPCPPPGSGDHHYVFTLYALSSPIDLPPFSSAADVRSAASGRTLANATLEGTYRR